MMGDTFRKMTRIAILLGWLFLVVSGCAKDPFSTRVSEDPRSIGGTYTDPVSAGIAAENLFNAYNELNLGNLSRTLADSFVFAFDFLNIGQPGEDYAWPGIEESRITDNVFRAMDTLILVWSPSQADLESDSTAVYYRTYEIMAVTAETPPDTTVYAGETILFLSVSESARWTVYRWEDRHLTGQPYSWADLKSRYR